jgi:hypothetical protein
MNRRKNANLKPPSPWVFSLAPAGKGEPFRRRLEAAKTAARANGLTLRVKAVTVELEPIVEDAADAARVRKFLKFVGRSCRLRAAWPMPVASPKPRARRAPKRKTLTPSEV